MSQQINLYQPIFRRERKVFSAATIAQATLVVAAGLAAIYGYASWQMRGLSREVATLEAQQLQAQAQFETLAKEVAALSDDSELKQQIEAQRTELASRQELLRWLGERSTDKPQGFSAHLAGLARQHRAGELWLDGVHLAQGGGRVTLEGGSGDPAAVVRYLRRLGQEPAFAGLEFDSVSIDRPAEGDGIRFRVSNVEAASP